MTRDLLEHDKDSLIDITYNMPEVSKETLENTYKKSFPESFKNIKNIIISGMGGSCISGDLFKTLCYEKSEIPVFVNRSSFLPGFADENSLCVFISYSGNTQETINCAKKAISKNCKCIFITYGGELKKLGEENNIFTVLIEGKPKMPRAAIGELFYSLSGTLCKIEKLHVSYAELVESVDSLIKLRDLIDIRFSPKNEIIELAKNISGKKLCVFGVSPFTEAVTLRLKNQFNENSKETVIFNSFPELTHNEIVGLAENGMENYYFIILRDPDEDKILKGQISAAESFWKKSSGFYNFQYDGKSFIERQMKVLYAGDYLSIYLALLKGVDPSPIDAIFELKDKIKDMKNE